MVCFVTKRKSLLDHPAFAVITVVLGVVSSAVADDSPKAAAADFVIEGECLDGKQEPIAGVRVRLLIADSRSAAGKQISETVSDNEGEFRFAELQPPVDDEQQGEYRVYAVVATDAGRASAIRQISSPEPGHTELRLSKPATLKGRVTNSTGEGIPDAVVYSSGFNGRAVPGVQSATTDADGHYELSDVHRFMTQMIVVTDPVTRGPKLIPKWQIFFRVEHPDYGRILFTPHNVPGTADLVMEDPAIVDGVVIDAVTNQPAANAFIYAQATNHSQTHGEAQAMTDDSGRFRLLLEPDIYNIWASKPERTVVALDSFEAVAGSNRAADMTLISGGFIEGRLIDRNGEPVGGTAARPIRIGLHGPSRPRSGAAIAGVLVESDGSYRIRVAPGDNYPYVSSAGIGANRDSRNVFNLPPVTVKQGETVTLDFQIASPVRSD